MRASLLSSLQQQKTLLKSTQPTSEAADPASSGASPSRSLAPSSSVGFAAVFERILECQERSRSSYEVALSEIKRGHKSSHWIWYVWPSLAGVRTTQRPELYIPSPAAASAYLKHPVLGPRLLAITRIANDHLAQGVHPHRLFGSEIDAVKFHEVCSCFYLAAAPSPSISPPALATSGAAAATVAKAESADGANAVSSGGPDEALDADAQAVFERGVRALSGGELTLHAHTVAIFAKSAPSL
jgi:uncharacterized protein (DUF1810 family)